MPSLAPLVPLAGAGAPWRPRRGWTVGISVLLHLLALAAFLGFRRPPPLDAPQGPAYDLVFETPGAGAPQQPPSNLPPSTPAELARPDDALASPPAPPPLSPPVPDAPPSPEPETLAAPSPPPLAAAPAPPAPPLQAQQEAAQAAPPPAAVVAPPALAFAPPPPLAEPAEPADVQAVPVPAAPPEVRLDLGPPTVPQPIMPTAPPALPPPVPAAPPRPRPPPRPQSREAPGSSLSAPMDFSFAPAAPPRPAPAPRGSLASRTIDLSLGPARTGPNRAEAFFEGRAKAAGADWEEGLKAYWLRHRYYPRQAAEAGEDGRVEIEMTVNRYGRVEAVSIKSGSGSTWIDMAALATWRNAQLPPLPAELKDDHLTLTIPIQYILIR